MSTAYSDFGDDLFGYLDGLDITTIETSGWAKTFNRWFEPDEVTSGEYPVLMVIPTRDQAATLDSLTDSDTVTYSAYIIYKASDVLHSNGEERMRQLVDLVRTKIRADRLNAEALGNAYDIQMVGEWGNDAERGERFYRLDVTAQIADTLD